MAEISHLWGSDLTLGPSGDLAVVSGLEAGRQRVLRRLLTAQGNYIWHLDYGSGLPGMIGQPANPLAIEAVVRQQMALEACVAQTPEPVITVTTDGAGSTLLAITYTDAGTGQTVAIGPADGLTFGASS